MTSQSPLYERDPEAWRAHLAEGNATQARKRVGANVILHDHAGLVLLVDPTYKPDWDLPGGMVEANERPDEAASRELREELGLDMGVGRLLCVDWVPPHEPWDDLLVFVFDGGVLSSAQAVSIRFLDGELREARFSTGDEASRMLRPRTWRRMTMALDALNTGGCHYLHEGFPVSGPEPDNQQRAGPAGPQ